MNDKYNSPRASHDIHFSAIVVTYNEDRRLRDCLRSLDFCNQIIVVDLGSTDTSVNIASEFGAEIIHLNRIPVVELVHAKIINIPMNDWVVILDPDEVMPTGIENDLRSLIRKDPLLGRISLPWQFYFNGKPLCNTIWGCNRLVKTCVLHRLRNTFTGKVHRGTVLMEGYGTASISRNKHNLIKHYWVDSYRQLFEKHWRYIGKEGESRYSQGERYSLQKLIIEPVNALKESLITCRGYMTINGIFLSFFYCWYVFMSILSLRKIQYANNSVDTSDHRFPD